jgi:hypothetical protein
MTRVGSFSALSFPEFGLSDYECVSVNVVVRRLLHAVRSTILAWRLVRFWSIWLQLGIEGEVVID